MRSVPRRDSAPELALRRLAHRRGLRYRVDAPIRGTRRRADLLFSRARVAVFVDGCFWHRCPVHGTQPKANGEWWRAKLEGNVVRDRATDAALDAEGWVVLRVWEHEDMEDAVTRLGRLVRGRTRAIGASAHLHS